GREHDVVIADGCVSRGRGPVERSPVTAGFLDLEVAHDRASEGHAVGVEHRPDGELKRRGLSDWNHLSTPAEKHSPPPVAAATRIGVIHRDIDLRAANLFTGPKAARRNPEH